MNTLPISYRFQNLDDLLFVGSKYHAEALSLVTFLEISNGFQEYIFFALFKT